MNDWRILKLIIPAFFACSFGQAFADQLYVIAHPGLTVEPDEIKDIFQGEKQFSGAINLTPTDNSTAQDVFLSKVMGMDKDKYTTAWVKKTFRDGVNQPSALDTDLGVIEFVKKTPGGIGYVISTTPSGVRIIQQY